MSRPRTVRQGSEPGRVELADSVRRLIAAAATTSASASDLAVARDLAEAAAAALAPAPSAAEHRCRTEAGSRATVNPFGSAENPLAPPLRQLPSARGEYVAEFTLSPAYEGPPGRAHGGIIAGILDHASGFAVASLDILAVTVSLTVNLHQATPYGEPLTVKAQAGERDGRKVWVDAAISTTDGEVTASCRALMLQLREMPAWARPAIGGK